MTTPSGRLGVIDRISRIAKSFIEGLTLSVGSKETRFASINLDIDAQVKPDVVGDARSLPFRSEAFSLIYFTDVIEHIPKEDEMRALNEIHRILKSCGILIFSTPNHRKLFTFLDPAYYLINHRHYTTEAVKSLLENAGFRIIKLFTAGGIWACIATLWYCIVTYPINKVFKRNLPYVPSFISHKTNKEYGLYTESSGYTIFTVAIKPCKKDL